MKISHIRKPLSSAPEGWTEKIVTLWTEDECTRNDPDAEKVSQAWDRIFCGPYSTYGSWARRGEPLDTDDQGDCLVTLYETGRVLIASYDGYSVGLLVEVRLDPPAPTEPAEITFTLSDIEASCRNIGYDLSCGACGGIFFTGASLVAHTCGKPNPQVIVTTSWRWLESLSEDAVYGPRVAALIYRMKASELPASAQISDEDRMLLLPLHEVPRLLSSLLPGAPLYGKSRPLDYDSRVAKTVTSKAQDFALDVREPLEGRRDGGADLAQALGRVCGLDASRPIQWTLNGSASRNTLVLSDRLGRTSVWTSQEGFSAPCLAKLGDVALYEPYADRFALIVLAKHLMGVPS
jgi:hypothetical protein